MEAQKQQQLQKLLQAIKQYNQKSKELEDFVWELGLSKTQDQVKEELAFTTGWTKDVWDEVGEKMRLLEKSFEGSLSKEQLEQYQLLKDYQMLGQLANQNNGKK